MDQIVKVVNVGDEPFRDSYNSQRFTIPPGSETLVPYAAACLWCGDNSKRDIDARRLYRRREYERLCTRYGVYHRGDDVFQERRPRLEVYAPGGERITMLAEDPHGDALTVVPGLGTGTDTAILQQQVDALKAHIEALQAASTHPTPTAPNAADTDEGDDEEEQPRRRPGRPRKNPEPLVDAPSRIKVGGRE